MTIIDRKLRDLADAISKLPAAAQDDVVAELEQKILGLSESHMTDEQRRDVAARLAEPREHASAAEVTSLLERYKTAK